jgi:hypothetical protein
VLRHRRRAPPAREPPHGPAGRPQPLHIEDTGFHQWIQYWHLGHVFRHSGNAVLALLLVWMVAFNLLQLFLYRRLGRTRRPTDPTETIRHLVEVMLRDLASLPAPIPWTTLIDSG